MPDTSLVLAGAIVPRPVRHPGNAFPDVQFRIQKVKVTLVATLELATKNDIWQAKDSVDRALTELRLYAGERMQVSYEKL